MHRAGRRAFATVDGGRLTLTGAVIAVDGQTEVRGRTEGPASSAADLGVSLAAQLIDNGAATLLSATP